jgi:tRNA G18 (ribose-2'-O)-methylase SpoU
MNEYSNLKELVEQSGKKVILAVENIRSAYNVGAMFRTADGAGNIAIVLIGYTPTPHNPKVTKTGLGAETVIPWMHVDTVEELFESAEKLSLLQSGLELTAHSENLFDFQLPSVPIVLYVGNEVTGLSLFLMTHLKSFVALPMNGIKASLNVAEATSIAIYELLRKQQF